MPALFLTANFMGVTYVPVADNIPEDRLQSIIEQTCCTNVIESLSEQYDELAQITEVIRLSIQPY